MVHGRLEVGRPRAGQVEVGHSREEVAEAPRLANEQQHRGRRDVHRPLELQHLRLLDPDAPVELGLATLRVRDLRIEVRDPGVDGRDLRLELLLLRGVVLERLPKLVLRHHRVGQVRAELCADLVDERLLLRGIVGGRVGGRTGLRDAQRE